MYQVAAGQRHKFLVGASQTDDACMPIAEAEKNSLIQR